MTSQLLERDMNMNSQARKKAKKMSNEWRLLPMKAKEEANVNVRMKVWMKGMNYNTLSVAYINQFPQHKSLGIFRRCHPAHRSTSRLPASGGAG